MKKFKLKLKLKHWWWYFRPSIRRWIKECEDHMNSSETQHVIQAKIQAMIEKYGEPLGRTKHNKTMDTVSKMLRLYPSHHPDKT